MDIYTEEVYNMRYIKDGYHQFAICDFCETDATSGNIQWIYKIGEKGICNLCIRALNEALNKGKK